MKSLSLCVFAIVLASGLCAPYTPSDDTVRKMPFLETALTDFIKSQLVVMDPITLPDMRRTHFAADEYQIDVFVSSSKPMVVGTRDFKSWSLTGSKMSLNYTLSYPELYFVSDYTVGGSILGNQVSGHGKSRFLIEDAAVWINVTLKEEKSEDPHVTSPYLQIDTLTLELQVGRIISNITGPAVVGVTDVELERVIDQHVMEGVHHNRQQVELIGGAIIQKNLNMFMKNQPIDNVIAWLKANEKTHFSPPTVPED